MLKPEALKKLADKFQTTEGNIRQEYIQHLFLSYFYQQPQTGEVYFKGGTALRLVYNSPRFSEDLDFSATLYEVASLEEAVLATLGAIEAEGIRAEIKEAKKTTGGYLAIILLTLGTDIVNIRLEVSLREGNKSGMVETIINDFIPTYTIAALAKEQLVGEKIQALLTREKPRDFYDLYFMLRANMIAPEEKKVLPQALEALQGSKIIFDKELKRFLPQSHWPIIRDFKTNLERELSRFL